MIKDCCKDPDNLRVSCAILGIVPWLGLLSYLVGRKTWQIKRVCRVCRCRHFEVRAKPIHIGMRAGRTT